MGRWRRWCLVVAAWCRAASWRTDGPTSEFDNRPLYAYPLPAWPRRYHRQSLTTYQIQKGDTLLDVGRWFGLTAKEISDANGHMDWWLPPAGRNIVLPTEHILPETSARRHHSEYPRDAALLLLSVAVSRFSA